MSAFRRTSYLICAALLAVACLPTEDRIEIPDNAIVYKIAPSRLTYSFVDSTQLGGFTLTWLPSLGYIGYNCIGLVPTTPTDTTGTFVFAFSGPNTGSLELFDFAAATTDTVQGFFLPALNVSQGTRGTWAVDQTGKLTLNWADGTQSRYFDPSATLRLFGDTITSFSDTRSNGDSVRVQWTVYWTFDDAC